MGIFKKRFFSTIYQSFKLQYRWKWASVNVLFYRLVSSYCLWEITQDGIAGAFYFHLRILTLSGAGSLTYLQQELTRRFQNKTLSMSVNEKIKLGFERSSQALSLRPSLGSRTGISKTRIWNGLTCEVREGDWAFMVDMPESIGGNAFAPTPGVYGRAAFGSCLAITYKLYAAKLNIPISSLEIEVQTDFDDGALLGTSDTHPGYSEVRYTVTIESEAAEEDILRMLDDADQHSPYLHIFSKEQNCTRKVRMVAPKLQL